MSEHPPEKKAPSPDWFDELRERLADWLGTLLNPPIPVPVPVRRRNR
jgi:hypothetical protein